MRGCSMNACPARKLRSLRPQPDQSGDGLIPLPELKDRLGFQALPEEDRGRYHTLSGMLMLVSGRLPKTGEKTEWLDWQFEILDTDNRKIDKVLATRRPVSAVAIADGAKPQYSSLNY